MALARYGGLRTPSETFALTWGCVDWERGRVRIPSPKTECHMGREVRTIPLFQELRSHLEAVFDEAEPGTTYVIGRHRLGSANLRTQLLRIMNRAGVTPWPRLFQNMRASRETELSRRHPLHVVTTWIGNSAPIAARHYLQVTDVDFDAALRHDADPDAQATQNPTQNPTRQPTGDPGRLSQEMEQALGSQGLVLETAGVCGYIQTSIIPPRGVEQGQFSSENTQDAGKWVQPVGDALADPALRLVVSVWPALPEPIRRKVLAIIREATTAAS
ncbi:MAG: site-specific integrase [Planctomycetia bacterium]|nr:site-specific integrase [Planctomycetia bacterium]